MNLNQSFLNITIPTKLLSWYKQFTEAVNKVLDQEKNINAKNTFLEIKSRNENLKNVENFENAEKSLIG